MFNESLFFFVLFIQMSSEDAANTVSYTIIIRIGDDPVIDEILKLRIHEMDLSIRPKHKLNDADIFYVGELVQTTREDLLKIRCMGRKSVDQIEETLFEMGLSLNMRIEGWPPPEMIH